MLLSSFLASQKRSLLRRFGLALTNKGDRNSHLVVMSTLLSRDMVGPSSNRVIETLSLSSYKTFSMFSPSFVKTTFFF